MFDHRIFGNDIFYSVIIEPNTHSRASFIFSSNSALVFDPLSEKVIIPSLSYVDFGGMGDNANKSVWTNIPNSKSFISFDIVFSSYKGEKLTDYLTDYDVDIRNIIYDEISKKKLADFEGSKGKKQLLEDIKNEINAYLVEKDLDPVVFGAHYKVFAITTRK